MTIALVMAALVARVDNSFEITVQGRYDDVAPLFGAWAERAWAGPDWNPEFLYPVPPRDEAGEVFTVAHGHTRAIWVNTAFDLQRGFIQYVYVVPEVQAVVIDVRVEPVGPNRTRARVSYRRTALDPRHNELVRQRGAKDREAGKEWEPALNAAVAAGRR